MIYFLLAMLSSAMISVLMRLSGKYVRNNITLLAFNYCMCSLLGAVMTQTTDLFPKTDGMGLTAALGIFNGILYLGSFVLFQWNISRNGVVLPATFMKLGVLVPTLMAMTVFGEVPTLAQGLGILGAVAAIILIQFEKGQGKAESSLGLIFLLLAGGSADGMSKVYETYGNPALSTHFLLYTFLVALILCVAFCVFKKQSVTLADALFGLLIGIPNYFSSHFLLKSLESIPAIVAYPGYSVGTIVLVTLAGTLFFQEKLRIRQLTALGIILAALALLNL